MDKSYVDLVKETASQLLEKIDATAEVTVKLEEIPQKRANLSVMIATDEPGYLIGQYGATLISLQHVVRLLVSAKTGRPCFAQVDVNDYKNEKEQKITNLAKAMAEKAVRTDSMVIMKPMSGFERRLVHVTIQQMEGVSTESMGQEPDRRVVVKPSRESKVVKGFRDKGLTLDDIKI